MEQQQNNYRTTIEGFLDQQAVPTYNGLVTKKESI